MLQVQCCCGEGLFCLAFFFRADLFKIKRDYIIVTGPAVLGPFKANLKSFLVHKNSCQVPDSSHLFAIMVLRCGSTFDFFHYVSRLFLLLTCSHRQLCFPASRVLFRQEFLKISYCAGQRQIFCLKTRCAPVV